MIGRLVGSGDADEPAFLGRSPRHWHPIQMNRGGVFFFSTQSQSESERGLRGRIVQKWTSFFGKNWAGLRGSSYKVLWVGYQLGHVERHRSKNPPDMFHIKTTPGEIQ